MRAQMPSAKHNGKSPSTGRQNRQRFTCRRLPGDLPQRHQTQLRLEQQRRRRRRPQLNLQQQQQQHNHLFPQGQHLRLQQGPRCLLQLRFQQARLLPDQPRKQD